jgi:protoporphyrinogen oxidase
MPPSRAKRRAPTAKTLIRNFFYPRLGPGQMWETAAEKIMAAGGKVFLDRKVQTIHWDETGVTHVTGTNQQGEFFQQEGSHFLSSIPLQELMLSLDPPPPKEVLAAARALRYRDFLTVCLIVNREKVFPDTWIYIHDPSVKVGRVQNYKNWSAAMVPDPKLTSLGMEYFCFEGDGCGRHRFRPGPARHPRGGADRPDQTGRRSRTPLSCGCPRPIPFTTSITRTI